MDTTQVALDGITQNSGWIWAIGAIALTLTITFTIRLVKRNSNNSNSNNSNITIGGSSTGPVAGRDIINGESSQNKE